MSFTKVTSLVELPPCFTSTLLCLLFLSSSWATKQQRAGYFSFSDNLNPTDEESRVVITLCLADSLLRWIGLRHAKIAVVIDEFRYREIIPLKRFSFRASG
jgi:hypothetical protein